MRNLTLVWLGGNAAVVGYFLMRHVILKRRYAQIFRLWLENEHTEALVMDSFRTEAKRQQKAMERIYRDAGLPMPHGLSGWTMFGPVGGFKNVQRVTDCQIAPHGILEPGLCVKAHCEAEAAEVVAQSSKFGARAA